MPAKKMTPTTQETEPITDLNFEDALGELEKLVNTMENGQLGLEQSMAAYRKGMSLYQQCQKQLTDAEEQLRIFDGVHAVPADLPEGRA